jgi:GTP pyrophosphokinase
MQEPGVDLWGHPLTVAAFERLDLLVGASGLDRAVVGDAARYASGAHALQMRRSGAPYITHPIEVAALVLDAGGTLEMVLAALLHDVVEDTPVTLEEIGARFGTEVASLVDGCTKVAVVHPAAGEAALEAARLRKLFVALARDPRVVVVKLCDRLHNLRTIGFLSPEKAARIGAETLAVHAPLAHRLGLGAMKAEMEDRAFAVADPEAFMKVEELLASMPDLHADLGRARDLLDVFVSDIVPHAVVSGRIKHRWSIHKKCLRLGVEPAELYDLLGLRVVLDSVEECYAVLASVHGLWDPLPGRFKDYVTRPKFNGYRSLHTAVIGPDGLRLEVQLRTREMHEQAEHGASAHHLYKNPGDEPAWLSRLLDWDGGDQSSGADDRPDDDRAGTRAHSGLVGVVDDDEYLDAVRSELGGRSEVLALTPGGDVIALPAGASVLDFAYAVHSELGHSCVGAKLDGRLVPLSTVIPSGARVEIVTGGRDGPSLEWVNWVVTGRARGRIRQFHAKRLKEQLRQTGRDRLLRAARELRVSLRDEERLFDAALSVAAVGSLEEMLELLGSGRLDPRKLLRPAVEVAVPAKLPVPVAKGAPAPGADLVVASPSLSGVVFRLAGCCRPTHRDVVAGIVTAGGVTVHTEVCGVLRSRQESVPGRVVPVFWVRAGRVVETVTVSVEQRPGLLLDLSAQLSSVGAELLALELYAPDRLGLTVSMSSGRLGQLRAALRLVPGVR